MSLGALLALLVLGASLFVLVFAPGAPAWLPWAMFAMLAVALLTGGVPIWPRPPSA